MMFCLFLVLVTLLNVNFATHDDNWDGYFEVYFNFNSSTAVKYILNVSQNSTEKQQFYTSLQTILFQVYEDFVTNTNQSDGDNQMLPISIYNLSFSEFIDELHDNERRRLLNIYDADNNIRFSYKLYLEKKDKFGNFEFFFQAVSFFLEYFQLFYRYYRFIKR